MDWITKQVATGNSIDAENLEDTMDAVLSLKPSAPSDPLPEQGDIECIPLIDGPGTKPVWGSEQTYFGEGDFQFEVGQSKTQWTETGNHNYTRITRMLAFLRSVGAINLLKSVRDVFEFVDWITDQIAIGNYVDAANLEKSIEAVLCLKPLCSCDPMSKEVDIECVPLVDGPGNSPLDVQNAINYIDDIVSAGDRILVHCHAGRSRSVVIVAQYLVHYRSMLKSDALNLISAKREVYLSPGIEDVFTLPSK